MKCDKDISDKGHTPEGKSDSQKAMVSKILLNIKASLNKN